MKAKKVVKTLNMPKSEWLKHRQNGIGGSEVGAILGLNPFQSSIELFYNKLGEIEPKQENIPMFMGNFLEDKVAELYQYYEKDNETLIKNYNSGKKINKIERVNYLLSNKDYPYLLGNIDRVQTSPEKCLIEIKTISGFAMSSWESGIPVYFLAQIQAYLMITGLSLCKLVMLKDGRYLEVYEVRENKELQKHIAEMCTEFWKRVEGARKLKAEGRPYESLEPEPDNSEAYANFLKDRYKEKPVTIQGGMELYEIAQKYNDCKFRITEIELEQQGYKNKLMNALKNASKIDFGTNIGYVSWLENAKGTRIFNCKIKTVELKKSVNF